MITREILKKIRQIELRTNRVVTETLAGAYHSVFKGQGMNFEEVREYQPGDEVRAIDWNVTARMNHPFSAVAATFKRVDNWCDVMILHLNTKYCRATPAGDGQTGSHLEWRDRGHQS